VCDGSLDDGRNPVNEGEEDFVMREAEPDKALVEL
jgi:hypothetical protein